MPLQLFSGLVCASGTLGQIVPPSIVLILLGDQLSTSYLDAQHAIGNFAPEPAIALIPVRRLVNESDTDKSAAFSLGFMSILVSGLGYDAVLLMRRRVLGPVLLASDIDPVWLGVLIAMNLQTSFLTPPFGLALFHFRSVAPAGLGTLGLYRAVAPFVALQVLALCCLCTFPALATWLPGLSN